jgi:3-methyladenine DNA glycosylase AlkD
MLALELWDSGIHEARILASMIAEPQLISSQQMEEWVNDFDS